jgi:F0F1-type ATP synthase assembly protein I
MTDDRPDERRPDEPWGEPDLSPPDEDPALAAFRAEAERILDEAEAEGLEIEEDGLLDEDEPSSDPISEGGVPRVYEDVEPPPETASQGRISDVVGAAGQAAEFDDEMRRELEEIERKARTTKAQHRKNEAKIAADRRTSAEDQRALGVGLNIAFAIVGLPLVGAGIGWLLNRQLGTPIWTGILSLAGATLGIVYAIYVLNRTQKNP